MSKKYDYQYDMIMSAAPKLAETTERMLESIRCTYGMMRKLAFLAAVGNFSHKLASSIMQQLDESGYTKSTIPREGAIGTYLSPSREDNCIKIVTMLAFDSPFMAGDISEMMAKKLSTLDEELSQPLITVHEVKGGSVLGVSCEKDVHAFMNDEDEVGKAINLMLDVLEGNADE